EVEGHSESAYGMGSTISIVQENAKELNLRRVKRLRQFVENRNHTLSHLAINWSMAHIPVHSVVCAAESIAQIDEYIASCEWSLTHEELAQVDLLMNFA
ncbi:aldo/keto reductase, partial [bacterium]|nr:aldo/keto reductase [bacterium]